jgi:hypothetical protein
MDLLQLLSILATVLGSTYYIHREMRSDILIFREEMRIQASRTDKLYEMFVTLQNEIKDLHGRSCVIETKVSGK